MSKTKKPRKKRHNIRHHANRMLVGMILKWRDTEPGSNAERPAPEIKATHTNMARRTYVQEMAMTSLSYIKQSQPLLWSGQYDTVFTPEGARVIVENTFVKYTTINDINSEIIEELEADRRRGPEEHYSHVEFTLECIGLSPPPPIEHQIAKELKAMI